MINKKYFHYVFVGVMALSMGFIMSFAMTALNLGFTNEFFMSWGKAFMMGVSIAFPTSLLIAPTAQKVAEIMTIDKMTTAETEAEVAC